MTAVVFVEPDSVAGVLEVLRAKPGAHIVAGGQMLVEQIGSRRIKPHTLVSLRHVNELCGLSHTRDGGVVIGAMATHRVIAEADSLVEGHTLLPRAALQIAGPAIRNVATIGGSICRVDASLDYPAVLATLDASVRLIGPAGERSLSILDFYAQHGVRDGELLVEVRLPPALPNTLTNYERVTRCEQDAPILSVAIVATMQSKVCRAVKIGVGSCGPEPIRLTAAETRLQDTRLSENDIADACALIDDALTPSNDIRATAAYRKILAPRVVARALRAIGSSR